MATSLLVTRNWRLSTFHYISIVPTAWLGVDACSGENFDRAVHATYTSFLICLLNRRELEAPVAVRGALTAVVSNVLLAGPANAGVLFDFNLTLPIIAGQFLALMFIMDKLVYSPVGEVLDKRDGELRSKLMAVKDNSAELGALAVRIFP